MESLTNAYTERILEIAKKELSWQSSEQLLEIAKKALNDRSSENLLKPAKKALSGRSSEELLEIAKKLLDKVSSEQLLKIAKELLNNKKIRYPEITKRLLNMIVFNKESVEIQIIEDPQKPFDFDMSNLEEKVTDKLEETYNEKYQLLVTYCNREGFNIKEEVFCFFSKANRIYWDKKLNYFIICCESIEDKVLFERILGYLNSKLNALEIFEINEDEKMVKFKSVLRVSYNPEDMESKEYVKRFFSDKFSLLSKWGIGPFHNSGSGFVFFGFDDETKSLKLQKASNVVNDIKELGFAYEIFSDVVLFCKQNSWNVYLPTLSLKSTKGEEQETMEKSIYTIIKEKICNFFNKFF